MKAHESGGGLLEWFTLGWSGPLERDRVCNSGGRQRWRAGRQTEPVQNLSCGIGRMNGGENPEPTMASGTFQHIDVEDALHQLGPGVVTQVWDRRDRRPRRGWDKLGGLGES